MSPLISLMYGQFAVLIIQGGNRRKRQSAMYRTRYSEYSPLIRASPLTTKESRLPEPVSFLRRIHNRQPCGALDKATD